MMSLIGSCSRRIALPLVCAVVFAAGGCRKSQTAADSKSVGASPNLDACSLVTRQEVEAVVGSPITDTKSSEHADGGLRVSQCFYNAQVFSKSVSLTITQSDPASAQKHSPKQYWKETFGRFEEKAEQNEGDEAKRKSLEKQEEEEAAPPKKIDGLADAAYWTANRVGGSLYALKNDVFVRVSVGGADTEQGKLEKSKKLAQKALDRL